MSKEDNLIWIDTETTGLNPRSGYLLEVAVVVTDSDLNEIDCGRWPITPTTSRLGVEARMADEVLNWHRASGLLDECFGQQSSEILVAQERVLSLIRQHTVHGKSPLAGNTIGFDKAWLTVHMPEVVSWCHYRTVDVSSIKELARRWGLPQYPSAEVKPHRALPDVRHSIEELRFYRKHAFRETMP